MNTENGYQRDADRHLPDTASPSSTTEPNPLATHRDPSQQQETTSPSRSKNGVAWVRPSDLPTMVGTKVIGRGLDLKAELVRRANRRSRPSAPKARVTKTSIAKPEFEIEPPAITHTHPGGISR